MSKWTNQVYICENAREYLPLVLKISRVLIIRLETGGYFPGPNKEVLVYSKYRFVFLDRFYDRVQVYNKFIHLHEEEVTKKLHIIKVIVTYTTSLNGYFIYDGNISYLYCSMENFQEYYNILNSLFSIDRFIVAKMYKTR